MSDNVLYILIIAGGRGTRFWPLSRRSFPKQCLSPDGGPTLIQRTIARLLPIVPIEHVLVVTSSEMAAAIQEQLPELPPDNLLIEPVGRNTAPAIAWGAAEIGRRARGGNPMVAVLPSDHLIEREDELRDLLLDCAEAARATNALVTVGLEAQHPETGFGYLEVGGELGRWGDRAFLRVERFVEKPDLDTALSFVAGGKHLWNAGMFVFGVEALRDALREHLPHTWVLLEQMRHSPALVPTLYPQLDAISFDHGVMERAHHVLTVRADLGWSDVGSWTALADMLPEHPLGRVAARRGVAIDASDNIVFAPGKVVAMVGVRDLVVVDTRDALLICHRDEAQRLREVVAELEREGPDDVL